MNVTEHILERYCERILLIPPAEINQYIANNHNKLVQKILELFDNSTFLFRGQVSKESKPSSFYIKDDIMLVASYEDKSVVTLYPIRLPYVYSSGSNKRLVRAIVSEIIRCQKQLEKNQVIIKEKLEVERAKQETLDKQAYELRSQLKLVEEKKKEVHRKIWEIKQHPENIEQEIKNLVIQLKGTIDDSKKVKKSS